MTRILVPLVLSLAACGAPEDVAVVPEEGTWTLSLVDASPGACESLPTSTGTGEAASFDLLLSSTTVFELVPTQGDGVGWGCLATEAAEGEPMAFSCGTWLDPVDWEEELGDGEDPPDATVRFEHDLAGSFTSSTEGEATLGFAGLCDGTGCEEASAELDITVPCEQEHAARLTRGAD